jgi:hypothetical protein
MSIYRAQRLGFAPRFTTTHLRDLLAALSFGYPASARNALDTNARLLLSAATYALEESRIDTGFDRDDRSRRLLSCDTDVAQLQKDVEAAWLKGLAKGTVYIASGYLEHLWTGFRWSS